MTPEALPALQAGGKAFVAATRLRLRERPMEMAPIAAHLPIGRAAAVVAVTDGWARLRAIGVPAGTDQWEVRRSGAKQLTRAAQEQRELEGWAPLSLLSDRAPDRAGLLALAEVAERTGAWPDAERALERAATLAPPDAALRSRLVRAAALSRDYGTAAAWAVEATRTVVDRTAYARTAARVLLVDEVARAVRAPRRHSDGARIRGERGREFGRRRRDALLFPVADAMTVIGSGVPWPGAGRPRTLWISAAEVGMGPISTIGFVSAKSRAEAVQKARALHKSDLVPTARNPLEMFKVACGCSFPPGWNPDEEYPEPGLGR